MSAMDAERAAMLFAQLKSYKDEGVRRGIPEVIAELHAGQGWKALNYDTWGEACDAIMGGWRLQIPREDRREIVDDLRGRGMSTRAIGAALGVSHMTVDRDLAGVTDVTPEPVTGLDGKTYPPRPSLDVVPDDEVLPVLADLGASPAQQRAVAVTQYPELDIPDATDEQIVRVADALNRVPEDERAMRLANGIKWLESRPTAPHDAPEDPIAPADKVIAAVNTAAITITRIGGTGAFEVAWQHADEFTREQWRASIYSLSTSLNDLASITDTSQTIRRIK